MAYGASGTALSMEELKEIDSAAGKAKDPGVEISSHGTSWIHTTCRQKSSGFRLSVAAGSLFLPSLQLRIFAFLHFCVSSVSEPPSSGAP